MKINWPMARRSKDSPPQAELCTPGSPGPSWSGQGRGAGPVPGRTSAASPASTYSVPGPCPSLGVQKPQIPGMLPEPPHTCLEILREWYSHDLSKHLGSQYTWCPEGNHQKQVGQGISQHLFTNKGDLSERIFPYVSGSDTCTNVRQMYYTK